MNKKAVSQELHSDRLSKSRLHLDEKETAKMKSGMRGAILAITVGLMFVANIAMAQENGTAEGKAR